MKKQAKYELIYQDLKQKILNGFFSDGRLPALAELTKCYDASLLTVNNAVKKLAEDGLDPQFRAERNPDCAISVCSHRRSILGMIPCSLPTNSGSICIILLPDIPVLYLMK